MSRQRTVVLALIIMLLAGALVAIFATTIEPVQPDGTVDTPVIVAFLASLTILIGAVATVIALLLHARWPALAGAHKHVPDPAAAVRQGMIAAIVCLAFLVLALLDSLDIAFVLVTILLAGLVETFIQVRR